MQYVIALPAAASDSGRFAELIAAEDPGAVLDRAPDAPTLRLSTCLTPGELHALATSSGMPIGAESIVQLPSECCGGCGG